MDERLYLTYNDIHRTVADLGRRILAEGFRPDLMVAIGSGGYIPARMLRTFVKVPILAVGVAYYDENNQPTEQPRKIQWLEEAELQLAGRRVLLVDEVDDSRATLAYCLEELLRHGPAELAVAVLHNKRKPKRATLPPEVTRYWAGADLPDRWVAYPWDALDIDAHDGAAQRAEV